MRGLDRDRADERILGESTAPSAMDREYHFPRASPCSPMCTRQYKPGSRRNHGPARLIVGDYMGEKSPVRSFLGLNYLMVRLAPGEKWVYETPQGHDVGWLSLSHGSLIGVGTYSAADLVVFDRSDAAIPLRAGTRAQPSCSDQPCHIRTISCSAIIRSTRRRRTSRLAKRASPRSGISTADPARFRQSLPRNPKERKNAHRRHPAPQRAPGHQRRPERQARRGHRADAAAHSFPRCYIWTSQINQFKAVSICARFNRPRPRPICPSC